jgi:hypothetical protein
MGTYAEKKHLYRVSELGCAVCRRMGYPGTPSELHHLPSGVGVAQRSSYTRLLPLCPEHARGKTGLQGLGEKGFMKHWGFNADDLLEDTRVLLNPSSSGAT